MEITEQERATLLRALVRHMDRHRELSYAATDASAQEAEIARQLIVRLTVAEARQALQEGKPC